ncbi:MAG: transcriptional regulator [Rubricoccaceae bacterium]|nr:transcriptional regulator [Rubricoccaceae bacterium]
MAEDPLTYRFGDFRLDVANRQLWRGEDRIDLNARYFDALTLLVQEHGRLVPKDRFFAEVWDDVVVSDSALTQCIKDVRKGLGDDAASPRYIETVPRHGYRFIEPVVVSRGGGARSDPMGTALTRESPPRSDATASPAERPEARTARGVIRAAMQWGGIGALGGGFAGVLGGLLYGSALAYAPAGPGLGTASVLVVLLSLNILVGGVGGFGVSLGMGAADHVLHRSLGGTVAGAALGGLLVGGAAKLLGVDAFHLLFGRAPGGMTGGLEGAALGAALALGARLGEAFHSTPRWRPVAGAGVAGAVAGALIPLAGGHLMGGSLALLAHTFDRSRLQLDALGRLFGEATFGGTAQDVLSSVEGLLFGSCVAGALVLTRHLGPLRRG